MSVFTRPLVPLSLSEPDVELLRYVRLLASLETWETVQFAHVVTDRTHELEEAERASLLDRMRAEGAAHFAGREARMELDVVHGPRLDEILSLAIEDRHDLIVLGHRRDRKGRRSLARRLAMVAPCSVWLVPQGAACALSNILVPVDFSSYSADALALAVSLAAARGLKRCRTVHVYFDPSTVRYDERVAEIQGKEEEAFAQMVAGVDCQGVAVEPIFEESSHPSEAILRVAERTASDLIVMNTRGRSCAAAVLLGSVTSDTLAATKIPLLAVKHFGGSISLLQALLNHRTWERQAPKTN